MAYINGKKILQVVRTTVVPATYQEKTISPNNFQREVTPDVGYAALSKVKIKGILIDPHTEIESQTDTDIKYQKTVPAGALRYAGLNKVGGLTKKYNQLVKPSDIQPTSTISGITFTNNGDGTITINGTATNDITQSITYQSTAPLNHKIYVGKYSGFYIYNGYPQDTVNEGIFSNDHGQSFTLYIHISNGTTINSKTISMISVDLTAIYGAGNEPSTVEQFLADYPKYNGYVEYNTGSLDYAYTKKVVVSPNTELLEAKITAIKNKLVSLGYSEDILGYGLDNVYNYIDLENKQVVLNMNGVDLGTLTFNLAGDSHTFYASILDSKKIGYNVKTYICSMYETVGETSWTLYTDKGDMKVAHEGGSNNFYFSNSQYSNATTFKQAMSGVPLIYELATPITIDVSDILDNDDVIGELESGGTITFENDNRYNLPSNVTYLVEVE